MERHDASAWPAESAASPAPWLRIHTLGQFQIDWFYPHSGRAIPLPAKKLQGQNASTALGLLKALLSCPDRFAARAWLNEQFWPNSRHKTAEERLNDVVSSLRTLLRPENCTEMFVHFVHGTNGRGAGFRLDACPQLWCDADAFEWYVKHAMLLDQRGQDSAACWERAFYLAERGHYLPEQVYEEWARQKRDYLTGLTRDCVHRWTALLRQMGHVDEAIMRLRSYWLEHLTDEDALRPLLDMLGERERFGEAEEYYAKAQAALAEDNHVPDDRTNETIEVVRALRIQRPSPTFSLSPMRRPDAIITHGQTVQGSYVAPYTSFISPSSGQLETHHMASFEETRRIFLKQLWGIVGLAPSLSPALSALEQYIGSHERHFDEPTGSALQQLIEICWQLCNAGRMPLTEHILESFLPSLIDRASFQPDAARLAAQGLRLKSILCAHQLALPQMIPLCQQSVAYAQIAGDPNVLSAAMNGLAVAFKYNNQYAKAFEAYQAALFASEQATPLLRSRVYAGAAASFASQGHKQEAFRLIGLAYEQYPDHPEHDPFFFSADNGLFMLAYYEGLLYLALEQPDDAYRAFERSQKTDALPIPERNRLETLNHLGRTAILSGDVDRYAFCLEEGVKGALTIRSQKRLEEALAIFREHMPRAWLAESSIQQILEKVPLPALKAEGA
jgi:DNA-binding SARP family transcriptional activator